MKLNEILSDSFNAAEWEAKGYELPKYDIAAVAKKTHDEPTWVHFGAGNIFRAFPAAILNDALNTGKYDRGVIVAESFDYEIIDKAYRPYNNLSLLVSLQSNGTIEKKVIASITESLKADKQFGEDWARLVQIFQAPSLQMVTFTITEKGYSFNDADLARGLDAVFAMGKLTALLYERYKAGKLPLTLQSTDNCSHNGDHVKAGVKAYAERWAQDGIVEAGFVDYINDSSKITYPWSMIDKITPRPHEKVQAMLAEDGFEDNNTIITEKHTFTAPFVNAEEVQYLVCEDTYTNGRPPLELGGALYTSRKTVDEVETMKVTTCLNPLHTAMSIYGCMLDYTLISAEMADEDLRAFIQKIGYIEVDQLARGHFARSSAPDTDALARAEGDGASVLLRNAGHTDFRPLRVEDYGDGIAHAPHRFDDALRRRLGHVRRVDPHHVHARLEEAADKLLVAAPVGEGRHDLGSFALQHRIGMVCVHSSSASTPSR